MASYLITGVSRGIGFEFLNSLSRNASNVIIGLVRNKDATIAKVEKEMPGRQNIHILEADITDYEALKKNVGAVSKITGGRLDYVIANAGLVPTWSAFETLDVLAESASCLETELHNCFKTNVTANVHLFNLFLPLVLRGNAKKVIAITSGFADPDPVVEHELHEAMPYSVSKSALNMVVSKYAAQYSKDGVLFLSLSPGAVDTGHIGNMSENELAGLQRQGLKFMKLYPDFTGPITPQASVEAMLSVISQSSIDKGHSGAFLSHHGDRKWL
ncbi:Short chain dehydrogenase virK [Paramyrothecium foliicola]|nr:Short chain dehydrogenase virK [Paramyrothecium foliicola]